MKFKVKEVYLLILIVLGLVSLSVYSTYALFTKEVTIDNVVSFNATLSLSDSNLVEYELVTLNPNETKVIELRVSNSSTSTLYYGCWYETLSTNPDITIGMYLEKSNVPSTGTIATSEVKTLVVGIVNNSTSTTLVNLGVVGSTTSSLGLSSSRIIITDTYVPEILVTDEVLAANTTTTTTTEPVSQEFTEVKMTQITLTSGTYLLEVWGAQGGSYETYLGGKGGYSKGTLTLAEDTTIFVYVGGQPATVSTLGVIAYGGFNGGGNGYNRYYNGIATNGQGGGGASDIRIGTDSLYARVIVAGGGGGSASEDGSAKYGGGTTGGSAQSGYGASQTSPGTNGRFGQGGSVTASEKKYSYSSGGGGGGWYGGGAEKTGGISAGARSFNGGGSGYVYTSSTVSSCPSGCLLNSNYYLTNAGTYGGNTSFTDFDGTTVTGRSGNGAVKITSNIQVEKVAYTIPTINGLTQLNIKVGSSKNLEEGVTYECESGSTSCTYIGPDITDTSTLELGIHIVKYRIKGSNNKTYVYERTINVVTSLKIDDSGANYPELTDALIPVVYDESASTWVKADTESSTSTYGWYDYNQKKWANAVLVKNTENLTKIIDLSNNGNDGKIYEATQSTNGLTLSNSTSQYVSFSSNIDLTFPVTYSVTFSTSSTSDQIIFGDYKTKAGLGLINSGAQLVVNLNSENATYTINTGGISLNTFYTIDLVYNSISNMDVYLNGTKLSKTASTNYWTWTDTNSYIGKRANGVSCFNGTIKRFMIYNDALTESEINYNLTADKTKVCNNGIICDNLKLYYNFEDSTSIRTLGLRENYLEAQTGTQISMNDILAFYVWIPRYKYKVWNKDKVIGTKSYNAQTEGIDIVFESDTSSTGTISCTYSYAAPSSTAGSPNETCTGSNGDYYTHPAFTFGDQELTGFWMGKFELSSSNPATGSSHGGGNSIALTPRILPNVTSWRYNTVSNFWKVIYDMQKESNIYGLPTSRTEVDSHMLTNMEWGAVAYLTNSKYGRCTNGSCTEVSINGYGEESEYTTMTGCGPISSGSTDFATTCNAYNIALGQTASTTGNIYGVYDMSGGAHEYVMGNMSSSNGTTYTYNASSAGNNFTYSTDTAKYLIPYAYGTTSWDQTARNRGRLGDATSEVVSTNGGSGGWYNDYTFVPYSNRSWFLRGGGFVNGSNAGSFYFDGNSGTSYNSYSTRATLTIAP